MGTVTRTRLLIAAFSLSLCGLGITAGAQYVAQTASTDPIIIDDGDAGFSLGSFQPSTAYKPAYGGDTAYMASAPEQVGVVQPATWTFSIKESATYDIFATWGELPKATAKANYMVSVGNARPMTYWPNQSRKPYNPEDPNDKQFGGITYLDRTWQRISAAEVKAGGTITVSLSPSPNAITLADAVMVRKAPVSGSVCKEPKINCLIGTAECCTNGTWACPNGVTGASGCKKQCTMPPCGVAPPKGCVYVNDSAVDENGCPLRACGELKCYPIEPGTPVCGNKIIEGTEQCDDGNRIATDGCGTMCKLCPIPTCAAPPANCTYVQDSAVNANGCPLRPCGELKCNTTVTACSDGIDNDKDGTIDTEDKGCAVPQGVSEEGPVDFTIKAHYEIVTGKPGGKILLGEMLSYVGDRVTQPITVEFTTPSGFDPDISQFGHCKKINIADFTRVTCTLVAGDLQLANPHGISFYYTVNANAKPGSYAFDVRTASTPQGDPKPQDNIARTKIIIESNVSTCTDTDGGYVPETKGRATSPYQSDEDNCIDTTKLKERVCENDAVFTKEVTCPNGTSCSDGACKKAADSRCAVVTPKGKAMQNQKNPTDVNDDGKTDFWDVRAIYGYYNEEPIGAKIAAKAYMNVDGSTNFLGRETFDIQDILYVVNNVNYCNLPAEKKLNLASVTMGCEANVNVAKVTYDKNFEGCAHVVSADGKRLDSQNVLCPNAGPISIPLAKLAVSTNQSVKICDATDYSKCSQLVSVTGTPCGALPASITLGNAVISCNSENKTVFTVNYQATNVNSTYLHLVDEQQKLRHTTNLFTSNQVQMSAPIESFIDVAAGLKLKLCTTNYGTCSSVIEVSGKGCETTTPKQITLTSASFSCTNTFATSATISYAAKDTSKLVLMLENGSWLYNGGDLTASKTSATVTTFENVPVPAGSTVKLCDSTNRTLCSNAITIAGAGCSKNISLASVSLTTNGDVPSAKVVYTKDPFPTCVHMFIASDKSKTLHAVNYFCTTTGETKTVPLGPTSTNPNDGLKVKEGDSVVLCHGNNANICSSPVTVTKEQAVSEKIELKSVVISTENAVDYVSVTYKKNFETCGHVTNENYVLLHRQNMFCTSTDTTKPDGFVTVKTPLKATTANPSGGLDVKEGMKVTICHGNKKGSVCSPFIVVTKEAGTTTGPFTSITNANPDADNTNVPTGISPMGQFKFLASSAGAAAIDKATFTVSTTNVILGETFKLYDKSDSTIKATCVVIGGGGMGGSDGNATVSWSSTVECSNLAASGILSPFSANASKVLVLETNVTNSHTSSVAASSARVTLQSYVLTNGATGMPNVNSTLYRT